MSTIDFNLPGDFTKLANARNLMATITAVNVDNTLNLSLSGVAIGAVPVCYHCRHQITTHIRRIFIVGDTVMCLYTGQGAAPAATNLTVLGFPGGYLRDCILTGIIMHPRSGGTASLAYTEYIDDPSGWYTQPKTAPGVAGGWRAGLSLLTTGYIYPLVDDDNGSFVVEKRSATITGEFVGSTGNYGNLYWTNGVHVLSWKGTPTRHFRLPGNIEIPGLSLVETDTSGGLEDPGDLPQFTTFGTKLYSSGELLAESPHWSWPRNNSGVQGRCLILGACRNNSDKKIYIVTQSDHSNAPASADLGGVAHVLVKPGFFLALWKQGTQRDGWDLVVGHQYSRNGLPWFANSAGTAFTCGNGDRITTSGALTIKSALVGTYAETANGAWLTINAAFADSDYHEYIADAPVASSVLAEFEGSSTGYSTDTAYQNRTSSFEFVVPPGTEEAGGVWVVISDDSWPSGTTSPHVYVHTDGRTKTTEYVYEGVGVLAEWSGTVDICRVKDGTCQPCTEPTGWQRSSSYGPEPSFSTFTAEPLIYTTTFRQCIPWAGQSGCTSMSNKVDYPITYNVPLCKYLQRRIVERYVCP